jgi:hypothetical protein
VKLREVGAGREKIMVGGEADLPKGDHDALERLGDMILIGPAARRPMGQAAASEGNYPVPHVVPNCRHAAVVRNVVEGCRAVKWVRVDVSEGAVAAKTSG